VKLKLLAVVVLLLVGGAAVFVSLGGLPAQGVTPSRYLTATAAVGDVTDAVAATGTIVPTASYALGFGADPQLLTDTTANVGTGTWHVTDVTAVVGKTVKKGDLLASADTADLELQLKIATNVLANATLEETIAKETLDDTSGTSATRRAWIAYRNARTARWQATQQRDDLLAQRTRATLVSPIDGIVTEVAIATGSDATGTAITVATSTFEVTAEVVESDVTSMQVGQPSTVTVDAIGARIDGSVSAIAPAPASVSGSGDVVSYPVTVTIGTAPTELRAGMTAEITIVTASATNVLNVPSEALQGTTGSYRVQVVGTDGAVVTRNVTVGLVTSTTAEIRSGLAAGDVVVTGISSAQQGTTTGGGGGGPGGGFGPGGGRFVPQP
jgi:membrane fusion protein, macrolide-specific efflux system